MDDLDFCMAIWQPWSSKSQKSEKCRMKIYPLGLVSTDLLLLPHRRHHHHHDHRRQDGN